MDTLILFASLLLGFLIVLRIGAKWSRTAEAQLDDHGSKTVEGAVFALVAFFIAFSFSSAQSRLEHRTQLLIEESNAVSTAYARVDLCEPSSQANLRKLYAEYLRLRRDGTRLLPDIKAAKTIWGQAETVGTEIWKLSIASSPAGRPERTLILQATNEMLDAANRRSRNAEVHVPSIILGALVLMSALAALLAGRSFGSKSKFPDLHQWTLACTFALTLTILVDLDHPRLGSIRIEAGDEAMSAIQQTIERDVNRG
ncbi:MAG: hypothetical protein JST40_09010 [Armatimonadetes bacterium]|nr:hypothetical protein [Armatimonadota bacterium]